MARFPTDPTKDELSDPEMDPGRDSLGPQAPEAVPAAPVDIAAEAPRPMDGNQFAAAFSGEPLPGEKPEDWVARRQKLGAMGALGQAEIPSDSREAELNAREAKRVQGQLAREAAKAEAAAARGREKFLQDQGVVFDAAPDGSRVPRRNDAGGFVYQPGWTSEPYLDEQTGRWVKNFRDETGTVGPKDMEEQGFIRTDKESGQRYFTGAGGARQFIGPDESWQEREGIEQSRAKLYNDHLTRAGEIKAYQRDVGDAVKAAAKAAEDAAKPVFADLKKYGDVRQGFLDRGVSVPEPIEKEYQRATAAWEAMKPGYDDALTKRDTFDSELRKKQAENDELLGETRRLSGKLLELKRARGQGKAGATSIFGDVSRQGSAVEDEWRTAQAAVDSTAERLRKAEDAAKRADGPVGTDETARAGTEELLARTKSAHEAALARAMEVAAKRAAFGAMQDGLRASVDAADKAAAAVSPAVAAIQRQRALAFAQTFGNPNANGADWPAQEARFAQAIEQARKPVQAAQAAALDKARTVLSAMKPETWQASPERGIALATIQQRADEVQRLAGVGAGQAMLAVLEVAGKISGKVDGERVEAVMDATRLAVNAMRATLNEGVMTPQGGLVEYETRNETQARKGMVGLPAEEFWKGSPDAVDKAAEEKDVVASLRAAGAPQQRIDEKVRFLRQDEAARRVEQFQQGTEKRREALAQEFRESGLVETTRPDGSTGWKASTDALRERGGPMLDSAVAEANARWDSARLPFALVKDGKGAGVGLRDGQMTAGVAEARRMGLLGPEDVKAWMPKAQAADEQWREMVELAGRNPQAKAFLASAVKSYIAMEGGVASAEVGGALTAAAVARAGLARSGAGMGLTIVGGIVSFLAGQKGTAALVDKIEKKMAEYERTLAGLDNGIIGAGRAAQATQPEAAQAGATLGMAPMLASSVRNLGKAAELEGIGKASVAARFNTGAALKFLGARAAAGAAGGVVFTAVRPAFDAVWNKGVQMAGGEVQPVEPVTLHELVDNIALGGLLSGQGIKFKARAHEDVMSVLTVGKVRANAGVGPAEKITPTRAREMFAGEGIVLDDVAARKAAEPMTPEDAALFTTALNRIAMEGRQGTLAPGSQLSGAQAMQGGLPVVTAVRIFNAPESAGGGRSGGNGGGGGEPMPPARGTGGAGTGQVQPEAPAVPTAADWKNAWNRQREIYSDETGRQRARNTVPTPRMQELNIGERIVAFVDGKTGEVTGRHRDGVTVRFDDGTTSAFSNLGGIVREADLAQHLPGNPKTSASASQPRTPSNAPLRPVDAFREADARFAEAETARDAAGLAPTVAERAAKSAVADDALTAAHEALAVSARERLEVPTGIRRAVGNLFKTESRAFDAQMDANPNLALLAPALGEMDGGAWLPVNAAAGARQIVLASQGGQEPMLAEAKVALHTGLVMAGDLGRIAQGQGGSLAPAKLEAFETMRPALVTRGPDGQPMLTDAAVPFLPQTLQADIRAGNGDYRVSFAPGADPNELARSLMRRSREMLGGRRGMGDLEKRRGGDLGQAAATGGVSAGAGTTMNPASSTAMPSGGTAPAGAGAAGGETSRGRGGASQGDTTPGEVAGKQENAEISPAAAKGVDAGVAEPLAQGDGQLSANPETTAAAAPQDSAGAGGAAVGAPVGTDVAAGLPAAEAGRGVGGVLAAPEGGGGAEAAGAGEAGARPLARFYLGLGEGGKTGRMLAAAERAGVVIEETADPTRAEPAADGTVSLKLNPKQLGETSDKGEAAVEEELEHYFALTVKSEQWAAEGRKVPFGQWLRKDTLAVLADFLKHVGALNTEQRREAEQGVIGAFNAYYQDFARDKPAVKSLAEVAQLVAAMPEHFWSFALELARMFGQSARSGRLTEETLRSFASSKLAQWVRAAIEAVKTFARKLLDLGHPLRASELMKLAKRVQERWAGIFGESNRGGVESENPAGEKPAKAGEAGEPVADLPKTLGALRAEERALARRMAKPMASEAEWNAVESRLTAVRDALAAKEKELKENRKLRVRFTPDDHPFFGNPIIAYIMAENGLLSKTAAKKMLGERWAANSDGYDGLPALPPGHNAIFKPGGHTLDEMAGMLRHQSFVGEDFDANALGAEIGRISKAALSVARQQREEMERWKAAGKLDKEQAKAFAADTAERKRGTTGITFLDVNVGDVVTVKGEELEVTEVDPRNGAFTLEDGKRYGTRVVEDGRVIYGKLEPAEGGGVYMKRDTAPEGEAMKAVAPFYSQLTRTVRGLPFPAQRVLSGVLAGRTFEDIARSMKMTRQGVQQIAARSLNALKHLLKRSGFTGVGADGGILMKREIDSGGSGGEKPAMPDEKRAAPNAAGQPSPSGREAEDYRGEHGAPTRTDGAPISDVTANGIYPADIYGPNGLRYYGTGDDNMDRKALGVILSMRGKPGAQVKIFRAVPLFESNAEKIARLEAHKRHILKTGKLPAAITGQLANSSAYYEWASNEIDRLKAIPEPALPDVNIRRGDWVTTVREYAAAHGKSALNGEFKIIQKTVRAGDIFTNGDSWLEWGYDPAQNSPESPAPDSGAVAMKRDSEAIEFERDSILEEPVERAKADAMGGPPAGYRLNEEGTHYEMVRPEDARHPDGVRGWMADMWAKVVRGRKDMLEHFAPGAKKVVEGAEIAGAHVRAGMRELMEGMQREIRTALGSTRDESGALRRKKFVAELLPTAARLNATGYDSAGNLVFGDFDMRAGELRKRQAEVMGVSTGDMADVRGELLRVGEFIEDLGAFQLWRPMTAERQAAIYEAFTRRYPETAHYLAMWIAPGMEDVRHTDARGVVLPEFNRFALRKFFGEVSPVGELPEVEGYVPDVQRTKSLAGAISGAVTNLLNRRWKSGAREYKSGAARESGNVRDLFQGFSIRAMEAHAERQRLAQAERLLPLALKDIPPTGIPDDGWMEVNETALPRLANAFGSAMGMSREQLLKLTKAVTAAVRDDATDEDRTALKAIVGSAWSELRGRKMMRREVFGELVRPMADKTVRNGFVRLVDSLAKSYTAGLLSHPFSWVQNMMSNELFKGMRAAQRALYGLLVRPAGKTASKLAFREAWELVKGMVTNRWWNQERINAVVPPELFEGNTGISGAARSITEERMTAMDFLKQANIPQALLSAARYQHMDVRAKQQLAYASYIAQASVAADEAVARGFKFATSKQRAEWMRNWLQNAPEDVHLRAYNVAVAYAMDYSNVPAWMDADARKMMGTTDVTGAANILMRLTIPFIKWPYNMARQMKRFAGGSAADVLAWLAARTVGTMPGIAGTKAGEAMRGWAQMRRVGRWNPKLANSIAHLGTFGLMLAALHAWLRNGKTSKDDVERLGRSFDLAGNRLDRAVETGSRVNISDVPVLGPAVRALAKMAGDEKGTDDYWMRVRTIPYASPMLAIAAATASLEADAAHAPGAREEALTAMREFVADFESEGVLLTLYNKLKGNESKYNAGQNVATTFGQALTDFATARIVPPPLMSAARDLVDTTQRRLNPSKSLEYNPGFTEGVKSRIPVLSKTLPPAGRVKTQGMERGMVDVARLEEAGAGKNAWRMGLNAQGRPQVSAVDADDLRKTPRWRTLLRFAGLNVKPVDREAYRRALEGQEADYKRALNKTRK